MILRLRLHERPLARALLILVVACHAPAAFAEQPSAAALVAQRKLLIIAHRGNSSKAPENTLPAFRSAVRVGADLVELDYYHASDGLPIVFHDKTLDRTTDAIKRWKKKKAVLTSFPSSKLRELDAGLWFGRAFRGTRIPTLRESLKVIQSGSTTLIERKGGGAKSIVDLIHQWGYDDRVVLQAFDWKFLAAAHRANPKLVLGALGKKKVTPDTMAKIRRTGARLVVWNHKDLTEDAVKLIHQQGYRAWCYTVNKPEDARRVIEFGIDGIITDKPKELMQIRRQR